MDVRRGEPSAPGIVVCEKREGGGKKGGRGGRRGKRETRPPAPPRPVTEKINEKYRALD